MSFCNNCGKQLCQEVLFCPSCGMKLENKQQQEQQGENIENKTYGDSGERTRVSPDDGCFQSTSIPRQDIKDREDNRDKVSGEKTAKSFEIVSTAYYLGMGFVYGIPLVGLITAIIIVALKQQSVSKRNYAKAVLIWKVIEVVVAIVLLAGLSLLVAAFGNIVKDGIFSDDIRDFSKYRHDRYDYEYDERFEEDLDDILDNIY